MRVLFVIRVPYAIEPHGVLLLAALCEKAGHTAALCILTQEKLWQRVASFRPDVVAYSVIGSDIDAFKEADTILLSKLGGRRVFRIMGGPHPTFFPRVLNEMHLDAICQGEGEKALLAVLDRLERQEPLDGIPNIALTGEGAPIRERLTSEELNQLPFANRYLYYQAVPYLSSAGLRSFQTSRGCPFSCTYCYNHVYNRMFRDGKSIMRRRSVGNVLDEIEQVVRDHPPVRFIRFFDDIFSLRVDSWLVEFSEEYRKRIGLPFYCLMRANTFTEETAKLLAQAGCHSISMAIEAGTERVRNSILKRHLSDNQMIHAFELARKYGLKTYGNTMVGIPGTTLEDDFDSLEFTRSLRLSVPTFSVCSPSRGTNLAESARQAGLLDGNADLLTRFGALSPLNSYDKREKGVQARIACLGAMYCTAPKFALPLVRGMIRKPVLPLWLAQKLGHSYTVFRIATRLFPQAIPRSPPTIARVAWEGIRHFW